MAWVLSTVQSISLEEGAPELPGFFIGQAESSPALTLVFEDIRTAEECANAMKRILDKAVGMRAHVWAVMTAMLSAENDDTIDLEIVFIHRDGRSEPLSQAVWKRRG